MTLKTVAIVLILAAAVVGGSLAMHGDGHRLLMKWLPAIHGNR
jgi:hypothetical protein